MKTLYFNTLEQFLAFLKTRRNNYPILAYVVFKKMYKQRSYELNFEMLINGHETIASMLKTHIDESDFKKIKFILSKLVAQNVTDLNKKAICYEYMLNDEAEMTKLYETLTEGLHNIQFSDFYA